MAAARSRRSHSPAPRSPPTRRRRARRPLRRTRSILRRPRRDASPLTQLDRCATTPRDRGALARLAARRLPGQRRERAQRVRPQRLHRPRRARATTKARSPGTARRVQVADARARTRSTFQSANFRADVWIDGHPLGSHLGSYLPFELRPRLARGRAHGRRARRLARPRRAVARGLPPHLVQLGRARRRGRTAADRRERAVRRRPIATTLGPATRAARAERHGAGERPGAQQRPDAHDHPEGSLERAGRSGRRSPSRRSQLAPRPERDRHRHRARRRTRRCGRPPHPNLYRLDARRRRREQLLGARRPAPADLARRPPATSTARGCSCTARPSRRTRPATATR